MGLREFLGHVPAERHLHYDAEGNLTGWTVVEREPRLNDADRADLIGLARFENEVCRCGYHPSLANNPDNDFTPETVHCPVCGGQAAWDRELHERDKAAEKGEQFTEAQVRAARAPRPADGRRTFMRPMGPLVPLSPKREGETPGV